MILFCEQWAILIGPSPIVLEHWTLHKRSTSMAPNCKLETNVLHYGPPFQFIFMRVELWDKSELLLGTSCELGDHHENMTGTRKKTKNSLPPPKRRKLDPSWVHAERSHWMHETFISKTVCHHFWSGLMAGAKIVGLRASPPVLA